MAEKITRTGTKDSSEEDKPKPKPKPKRKLGNRRKIKSKTKLTYEPLQIKNYIAIENVYPELDSGRFPVKRTVGEALEVWADIFNSEHGKIGATIKYRKEGTERWDYTPMQYFDNDRWTGKFLLSQIGRYEYSIEAWTDTYNTLIGNMRKWFEKGEDISMDIETAITILKKCSNEARTDSANYDGLSSTLDKLSKTSNQEEILEIISEPDLLSAVNKFQKKEDLSEYKILNVVVDREKAAFSAWYEMFHRSQGSLPDTSSTFRDCINRLPEISEMGFDVIYLPPLHPIGRTNRRGANNTDNAGPQEPGSPWAIGNELEGGGHMSIHAGLGSMEDFKEFIASARNFNIELALDLSFQCSPDHPYVKEHPEWFFKRNDGSIRYAENPPKRYFDIYPFNFRNQNWKDLWQELLNVVLFWIDKGIRIFRVDNPHTKPFPFWEWLIRKVHHDYPETIFLSEAFTRPKLMKYLAKLGFTQSYTYFTWKNTKPELAEFISDFLESDAAEYYRGNLFTNTPDILHEYLQKGGTPAFKIRIVLAATLSSVYGIYNGYELCENKTKGPNSEEYMDSEKYQYKMWDWNREGNIKTFIANLNKIRRNNPALHTNRNLKVLHSNNDQIIFYGKWDVDKNNVILVAVNLDPFNTHESIVQVPIRELGLVQGESYEVYDLLDDTSYSWRDESNYVKLDPQVQPAHIFLLKK